MNLNEYFSNVSKFKNKIIVITVKDEASRYISGFTARYDLGLNMNLKFRGAYVAVIDPKRDFLYEKNSDSKIECSYRVGKRYVDIVSAGFESGNVSSVKVDGDECSLNQNGINVVILKHKSLSVTDRFSCNSFLDKALTIKR